MTARSAPRVACSARLAGLCWRPGNERLGQPNPNTNTTIAPLSRPPRRPSTTARDLLPSTDPAHEQRLSEASCAICAAEHACLATEAGLRTARHARVFLLRRLELALRRRPQPIRSSSEHAAKDGARARAFSAAAPPRGSEACTCTLCEHTRTHCSSTIRTSQSSPQPAQARKAQAQSSVHPTAQSAEA